VIAGLSRRALATVIEHARRSCPAECCGVLVGRPDADAGQRRAGDWIDITEAVPAANLAKDPNRFLLDPHDHMAARRSARARGLAVVGFYHSHPRSPAAPSARDVAEAAYPDHVHLIVSLQTEPPLARLYVIDAGAFREVQVRLA
jgi:proteasome lid subunit RPN8/RPN11